MGWGELTSSPTQYFPAVLCRICSRAGGKQHEYSKGRAAFLGLGA